MTGSASSHQRRVQSKIASIPADTQTPSITQWYSAPALVCSPGTFRAAMATGPAMSSAVPSAMCAITIASLDVIRVPKPARPAEPLFSRPQESFPIAATALCSNRTDNTIDVAVSIAAYKRKASPTSRTRPTSPFAAVSRRLTRRQGSRSGVNRSQYDASTARSLFDSRDAATFNILLQPL